MACKKLINGEKNGGNVDKSGGCKCSFVRFFNEYLQCFCLCLYAIGGERRGVR